MYNFIKSLSDKILILVKFFIFFSVIASFLEIMSLASIPILFTLLADINPETVDSEILKRLYVAVLNLIPKDELVAFALIFMLGIFFIKSFFLAITYYLEALIEKRISIKMSENLFLYYLNLTYLDIKKVSSTSLIRNFNSEITLSFQNIKSFILVTRELILFSFIITALFLFNFNITFYVIIILGLALLIFYIIFQRKIKSYAISLQEYRLNILDILSQTFGSVKETKIYKLEKFYKKTFEKILDKTYSINLLINLIRRIPRLYLEILAVIFIISLVYYFSIIEKKDFSSVVAILSFYIVCLIRLTPCLTQLNMLLTQIKQSSPSFQYIKNMLINFNDNNNFSDSENKSIKNIKLKKELIIKNLKFSYDEKNEIFDNVNLKIKANSLSGFYGQSGSGKSTLIDIICGIIKVEKGQITIDNKSIYENLDEWQNSIAYIPQDIYLFNDTVFSNVTLGIDKSKVKIDEIKGSLRLAQVDENLIDQNKFVGEKGNLLSGGQKQRVGIARALYRKKNVLIFDEPTSNLDKENSSKFLKTLKDLSVSKTIIIITHNSEFKKYFDNIFHIEDKLIVNK